MLAQISSISADVAGVTTPSPWFAGLIGALAITAFFGGLGGLISHRNKWDDKIRVLIGIFMVSPILLSFPIFGIFGQLLRLLVKALVTAAGGNATTLSIVTFATLFVVAVGGVYIYYSKRTGGRLALMAVSLSGLLAADWVTSIASWTIAHGGVPVWNGLIIMFEFLRTVKIHIG